MTDLAQTAPVPVPDPDTAGYWQAAQNGELRLQWCRDCSRFQHFPAPRCGRCLGTNLDWRQVSGRGTVYSFTVVHHAVVPGYDPPYVVVWVELEEQPGLRVLANLTDASAEDARIGLPVQVHFERRGAAALPQFRARDELT